MQTVYLNGDIAKFGQKWETDCTNIRDIFKLIECQTPGFRNCMCQLGCHPGFDNTRRLKLPNLRRYCLLHRFF